MYVCQDRKLVYIRVPKTGSTAFVRSFGDALHEDDSDHETARNAEQRDKWQRCRELGYTTIGFVRHPLAWVRSMHSVCQSQTHWPEYATGHYQEDIGLSEFAERIRVTPFDWFTGANGVLIDKIYRTEDL